MKVIVLFFGATADAAGTRTMELDIDPDSTSRRAFQKIVAERPQLSAYKLHFAVNQEYAEGGEIIREGDELAVFTPVSGG